MKLAVARARDSGPHCRRARVAPRTTPPFAAGHRWFAGLLESRKCGGATQVAAARRNEAARTSMDEMGNPARPGRHPDFPKRLLRAQRPARRPVLEVVIPDPSFHVLRADSRSSSRNSNHDGQGTSPKYARTLNQGNSCAAHSSWRRRRLYLANALLVRS